MLLTYNLMLFATFFPVTFGKVSFVILHMNDVHGKVAEVTNRYYVHCPAKLRGSKECLGGLSRAATIIEAHREAEKQRLIQKVIFLSAGNDFTGSVWFREHGELIIADFVNLLKPDALAMGAREIEYGMDVLTSYLKMLHDIPVLCTNINYKKYPQLQNIVKRHTIIDVFGTKVGIIGFVTDEVLVNKKEQEFEPEIAALREESIKLKESGVSIIIAVGSTRWNILERIGVEVPHINIVIGGQARFLQWNPQQGHKPDEIHVKSAYPLVTINLRQKILLAVTPGHSRYMGQINVTFDDNGVLLDYAAIPIFLNSSIAQDPKGLAILSKYEEPVVKKENHIVAQSKVLFEGGRTFCTYRDCNFGNIFTDAMVDWAVNSLPSDHWSAYPIAFFPSEWIQGRVDPTITDDQITAATLYDALPFDSKIGTCSLTGTHLIQVLENSVANEDLTALRNTGYLQVSGAKFLFNMGHSVGSRISNLRLICGACTVPKYMHLEPTAIYNIVTINHLLEGGCSHTALQQHAFNITVRPDDAISLLMNYLMKNSPVYPQWEGRIHEIRGNDTSVASQLCSHCTIIKFMLIISVTFLC